MVPEISSTIVVGHSDGKSYVHDYFHAFTCDALETRN